MDSLTKRTITVFMCVVAVCILILCYSKGISGNDFWWHVKVGEWITENRCVPDKDIFSWVGMKENIDWTPHEWLSDVIFYGIYTLSGNIGIFLFSFMAAAAMCGLIIKRLYKKIEVNFPTVMAYIGFFIVISSVFFYGRPHIFSYFLLYWELDILYKFRSNENYKGIFLIPVIAALWSNLHGGSSNLSYILCIIMLLCGLKDFSYGRIQGVKLTSKQIKTMLLVSVMSCLFILINPVGLDVFLYPYKSMSDSFMLTIISEWASPDAKKLGQLICFFVPAFLILHGMIFSEKKLVFTDAIYMLMFLLLFFRSCRFIILFCIAAVFFSYDYFIEVKVKNISKSRDRLIIYAVSAFFIVFAVSDVVKVFQKKDFELVSKCLNEDMVTYVKSNPATRLFNDYDYGGELIYNDVEVFFDARADLFAQKNILKDGIGLLMLVQTDTDDSGKDFDPNSIIDKYGFDGFLISKSRPLYSYLMNDDEYVLEFESGGAAYFVRDAE